MLEHTRKPPTDAVALAFIGPAERKGEALEAMRRLGFAESKDSIPWREAFDYSEEQLPGVALAGARFREGLTQKDLSEKTGIPIRHISEMENAKRPIGKQNARKLADALGVGYRIFL